MNIIKGEKAFYCEWDTILPCGSLGYYDFQICGYPSYRCDLGTVFGSISCEMCIFHKNIKTQTKNKKPCF